MSCLSAVLWVTWHTELSVLHDCLFVRRVLTSVFVFYLLSVCKVSCVCVGVCAFVCVHPFRSTRSHQIPSFPIPYVTLSSSPIPYPIPSVPATWMIIEYPTPPVIYCLFDHPTPILLV